MNGRRVTRRAAFPILLAGVLGATCDQHAGTSCRVFDVQLWEYAQFEVSVTSPDRCPVPLTTNRNKNYSGSIKGKDLVIHSGSFVDVRIHNTDGAIVATSIATFTGAVSPFTALISTQYLMATGTSQASPTADNAYNRVFLNSGALAIGRVEMLYDTRPVSVVSSPTSVATNTVITPSVQLVYSYPTPITYKWYINGTLTSITTPSFPVHPGKSRHDHIQGGRDYRRGLCR